MVNSRIDGVARWRHAIIVYPTLYKFNVLSNNKIFVLNSGFEFETEL